MVAFFPQNMVPEHKPEWNREAITVFSRLPSLMAADKPCPQLQPSLLMSALTSLDLSCLGGVAGKGLESFLSTEKRIQENMVLVKSPIFANILF